MQKFCLKGIHLNGSNIGYHPQMQKLEWQISSQHHDSLYEYKGHCNKQVFICSDIRYEMSIFKSIFCLYNFSAPVYLPSQMAINLQAQCKL